VQSFAIEKERFSVDSLRCTSIAIIRVAACAVRFNRNGQLSSLIFALAIDVPHENADKFYSIYGIEVKKVELDYEKLFVFGKIHSIYA